jgi:hypothetical protein
MGSNRVPIYGVECFKERVIQLEGLKDRKSYTIRRTERKKELYRKTERQKELENIYN